MCVCVCVLSHSVCDSMDYGLRGSSVHGIFQARLLELVAISYSGGNLVKFEFLKTINF